MAIRNRHIHWLRSLANSFISRTSSKVPSTRRRIRLEHLEPRYALNAAPVANEDPFTVEKNTTTNINVLVNDTDADPLTTLTVAKVNGNPIAVGQTVNTQHGEVTLNSNHTFDYEPDLDYDGRDGLDFFSYQADDGSGAPNSLSNSATVILTVTPIAIISGSDIFIKEGDQPIIDFNDIEQGVWLHADDTVFIGADPTYYWYIDATPSGVPIDPSALNWNDTRVLEGADQDVTWEELNLWGITTHTDVFNPAHIALRVIDAAGQVSYDQIELHVQEVAPEVLPGNMTVQLIPGTCGADLVLLTAIFHNANPFDTNFTVGVDWNWDLLGGTEDFPVPDESLAFTDNGDGSYTVTAILPATAITHDYGPLGGTFLPAILIVQDDGDLGFGISDDLFIVVPPSSGGGGPPSAAIDNAPAGGVEGTLIQLTSTAAPACGGTLNYAWNVSKNGVPGFATGMASTFDFTPDDDGSYVVSLTVTEGTESTTVATAPFTVTNVAPTANLSGETAGISTQVLSFTANVDDVSPVDRAALITSINWGDGSPVETLASLNNTPTHAYASAGSYNVTVSVTDDGGTVTTTPHVVTIGSSVNIAGTTFAMEAGSLSVTAPATHNTIALSIGSLIVVVDGVPTEFDPAPSGVTIQAGDGNDSITVDAAITTQVVVHGGAGNDTIVGGSGNDKLHGGGGDDIVLGQGGDDLLVGGQGRDILIGGDGKDGIHGKTEDDILVSGIVDFGANLNAALAAIQAEWLSGHSFAARTANIEGSGCDPTAYQLNSTTVLDDNDKDMLHGDQGLDWFFANLWLDGDDEGTKDKIVDINLFELCFANDLDFISAE